MALDPKGKVLALIELAVGKTTPPHEASSAAVKACREIHEGFVLSGGDERERPKILSLIALAAGKTTPRHEASAAGMVACRKIHNQRVIFEVRQKDTPSASSSSRRSHHRRDHGFSDHDHYGESDVVRVDIPFIIMTQSASLYRVARIDPPKRFTSQVYLIPKEFVESVVMMTPEETKTIGWGQTGNIIKSMRIKRSYFDMARDNGWDRWH